MKSYVNLFSKLDSFYSQRELLLNQASSYSVVLNGIEFQIDEALKEDKDLLKSLHNLRILLDIFSNDALNLLRDLINKGLSGIFYDRKYFFDYEITDTKRKLIKFVLKEQKEDGSFIVSAIPDSIGGGVQVVISIIIQLFLIKVWDKRPFLLLDEAFTQISSQYIEPFMNFLKFLVSDMDFNVLWITHDKRVLPYFNNIYNVNLGNVESITLDNALQQLNNE